MNEYVGENKILAKARAIYDRTACGGEERNASDCACDQGSSPTLWTKYKLVHAIVNKFTESVNFA